MYTHRWDSASMYACNSQPNNLVLQNDTFWSSFTLTVTTTHLHTLTHTLPPCTLTPSHPHTLTPSHTTPIQQSTLTGKDSKVSIFATFCRCKTTQVSHHPINSCLILLQAAELVPITWLFVHKPLGPITTKPYLGNLV